MTFHSYLTKKQGLQRHLNMRGNEYLLRIFAKIVKNQKDINSMKDFMKYYPNDARSNMMSFIMDKWKSKAVQNSIPEYVRGTAGYVKKDYHDV